MKDDIFRLNFDEELDRYREIKLSLVGRDYLDRHLRHNFSNIRHYLDNMIEVLEAGRASEDTNED